MNTAARPTDVTTTRGAARWPTWLRVATTPVLLFAALLVGQLALAPLAPTLNAATDPAVVVPVVVLTHVSVTAAALGLLWLMVRFVQRCRLRDIGVLWSSSSSRLLGLGLLISIVITVPVGLVLEQLGLLRAYTPMVTGQPAWAEVVIALSAGFLLQGLPEEWLFRGWLLRVLGSRPVRAVWVSALLFGSLHAISAGGQESMLERVVYVAMAVGFGLSAGALAVALKSVWVAIGIHAGVHVSNIIGTLLGMGQGPWLWGAVATCHVAVGLSVLRTRVGSDEVVLER